MELPAKGEFGLISFLSVKEMESLGVFFFVLVSFRIWGLLFLREKKNTGREMSDIFYYLSLDVCLLAKCHAQH